ncbi:MAG: acetylornithine deacetylase/succinyl-diaminopimelate desuccinylase-like protein [Actinomycetes bacterium]|jgi:acetylornithine deacetylase/succinyl-diaminopimelate desuccinylase-like protein
MASHNTSAAQDEVAQLVSELIQIDTSNFGNDDGPGEVAAADYVQQRLAEVGIDSERFATTSDKRQGVVARIAGRDSERGALLLHGHLDVVPAPEPDWQHPAFSGLIDDEGMIWGRGAVDMKDMDGMMLAVIRNWARLGIQPDRDIVALWLPDEEAGGTHGSAWLVDNRPEIFAGVTEAVGEVGGFSVTLRDDLRIYPIQTAEKGIAWLRLAARGTAGHGSFLNEDNAVVKLCQAAADIGQYRHGVHLTPTAKEFVARVEEVSGIELDLDDPDDCVVKLGALGRVVGATVRNTSNVTMLDAGYKANVIPESASAVVDGRFVPGQQEEFVAHLQELVGPEIETEVIKVLRSVETTFDGPTVDAMAAALKAEDEHAYPAPYLMSGGTDAKHFDRLGIRCFGFSPLLLPKELDFFGMFHNVNERVPVSALKFGVKVLDRFLLAA